MNFDYYKRHNSIRRLYTTIIIILIAIISLIITIQSQYSLFHNHTTLSSSEVKSQPNIMAAKLSASKVVVGESFDLTVTAMNNGDTSDMQFVALAAPNITSLNNIVEISNYNFEISKYNFTQKPVSSKLEMKSDQNM